VRKVVVVKPEVVVYFGLLLVKSEFGVAESEKRVASIFLLPIWPREPPGRSFCLILACIAQYRTSTARKAFYKKPGAPDLNLWPESTIQKKVVITKVPEMVRKVVKLTVIRKTSWSNLKWICKTGSSCVLWPTFDVKSVNWVMV